jgi:hypothetical protein
VRPALKVVMHTARDFMDVMLLWWNLVHRVVTVIVADGHVMRYTSVHMTLRSNVQIRNVLAGFCMTHRTLYEH